MGMIAASFHSKLFGSDGLSLAKQLRRRQQSAEFYVLCKCLLFLMQLSDNLAEHDTLGLPFPQRFTHVALLC